MTIEISDLGQNTCSSAYTQAAAELHRAEMALHDARQADVDAWVRAASDHLHRAVLGYEAVRAGTISDVAC